MIYNEHIRACNIFAQTSPANLRRVLFFVLATIQQRLETVPTIVESFERSGTASRFSWGMKTAGIDFANNATNMAKLYADCMQAIETGSPPEILLAVFLRVPGLGLVKAGFACQLFANVVGCIDVHNVRVYDIPLNAVRYNYKLSAKGKAAQIVRYVALCSGLGGSSALWSRWCDIVAALRPNNWANGAAVSQWHIDALTGDTGNAFSGTLSDSDYVPNWKKGETK